MSLFITAIGRARPPTGPVGSETYQEIVQALSPAWYLPLAETSGTTAAAVVGLAGTYVNSPQLGVDPIAQDDTGGKSVGLFESSSPPHITVASRPLSSASFTIHMLAQLDTLAKSKHTLITSGGGANPGDFEVSVRANGQPWAWSEDGTVWDCFGAEGDVPQGKAVSIVYQRQSNVAGWSQRLYVDGTKVAEDTTQRTWSAPPDQTWYIGVWSGLLDPVDGLIAHVAGWNSLLTPTQISDLARAQSVAWAEDIDAGAVQESGQVIVNVRQGGWHGKTPLVAAAGDGALVTTAESGEEITVTAGSTSGDNDTFMYSFTDANGNTSPTKTVTIDVTEAAAGVSIGALTAFQSSRIQVTGLAGWPAGRTPKEVVTQGTHAHGFVRRGWKLTNNDGTYMDFQAGWRKTLAADVIKIKLDDNSELDLSYTVNHSLPGTATVTLAKSGGTHTDWISAIAAAGTNGVVVVRAASGMGANGVANSTYPVDTNTSGASRTVSGVRVVAHPDDLAAGRRPRIHVQGTKFARYADDLNNGHWERKRPNGSDGALGGIHGAIWRTTQVVGSVVNVGCSYRTVSGALRRCYTYTNTPGTPGALARLQDTSYPRISRGDASSWDLYMGPGIWLNNSDGRLYIRLTPITSSTGAKQTNPGPNGPNPPWDWSQEAPQSQDPNQCQLYISSSDNRESEGVWPTSGMSYLLRINGTSSWTLENLDLVGGGNTIEMNDCDDHTLRGCRFLGWAPPNMEDQVGNTGVGRVHNMFEAEGTYDLLCDRCEFWGGGAAWFAWEENKAEWGAYGIGHKVNLWYMNDGGEDSFSARFLNCYMQGFASINIRGGRLRYIKFHQSTLHYCGMDGLMVCRTPLQTFEFLRSHLFEGSLGGWTNQSADLSGSLYIGYSMLTNFRPFLHDRGWWDNDSGLSVNQFVCSDQTIGHGVNPDYKECKRHFYYNSTAIGAHNHLRASVTRVSGNMTRDGGGAFLFPNNWNRGFAAFWTRNNILAVRPNGSLGDSKNTRASNFGDSHVAVIPHPNHIGNQVAGAFDDYDMDYDMFHRDAGMPTLTNPSNSSNAIVTILESGDTGPETPSNSISEVRTKTGQENNGRFANPLFAGAWDHTKHDAELHNNAFWCLQSGSPARTGGDGTNRSWLDVDFGTVTTYGGNTWLGCMDPDASAVEQQVGPLGPLPGE